MSADSGGGAGTNKTIGCREGFAGAADAEKLGNERSNTVRTIYRVGTNKTTSRSDTYANMVGEIENVWAVLYACT
jgi:hypothetical protein